MAKDQVEVDALSAMGFSVGCQVMAMREAITSQLGLSPERLEAFNAAYDRTYRSEMEMLIEELEDEGPVVAELLREMVEQNEGEPSAAREREAIPVEAEPEGDVDSEAGAETSLLEKIESACASVAGEKPCLLSRKLDAKTIAGRIACHLQPLMAEGLFVDCGYNKGADGLGAETVKRLSARGEDSLVPGIIIHDRKRGTAGNVAVIEAVWSSDKPAMEEARAKVGLYLEEPKLAYKSGFLILLGKDSIRVEVVGEG